MRTKPPIKKPKYKIGQRIGYLTIQEIVKSENSKNRHCKYRCICKCGKTVTLLMNDIQRLSQEEAERAVQFMLHQVGDFFTKRTGQLN